MAQSARIGAAVAAKMSPLHGCSKVVQVSAQSEEQTIVAISKCRESFFLASE